MKNLSTIIKSEKFKKRTFIVVAIVLIVLFCVCITPVTLQNDTFYTIKIGELISQNGIDMQDHFSWHENLTYTYPHWLYDLLTYFIYSLAGFTGIYVTTCILCSILGITLYFVTSRITKNYTISFITTIGALYLTKSYIAARAQLLTFILFILAIYFIEMFLKSKKVRYGIGLVLISFLIANLHCAVWPFLFVLFLPYIAEYLVITLGDTVIYSKLKVSKLKHRIKKLENLDNRNSKQEDLLKKAKSKLEEIEALNVRIKEKRDKKLKNPYKICITKKDATKWLIVVMIVCILVGFLTPIGTTPFTYLIKTMQGNSTENINEHLPMTVAHEAGVIVVLIMFFALLIFSKAKISLADFIMLSGLLYLMLSSRRQLSMFALIGSIIFAKLLLSCISIHLTKKNNQKDPIKILDYVFTDSITMLMISILTICICYYMVKDKFDDSIIDSSTYPVEASQFILDNIDLESAKFFNEYNYGSYLLFRGIPVFVDSRADLYTPEFNKIPSEDGNVKYDIFSDFLEASNIGTYYGDIFDKYGITHVILYKNSKVNMLITKADSEKYKELYSDDHFVIYEIQK